MQKEVKSSNKSKEKLVLKNQPNPAKWRQQDIAAGQPIFTAKTVLSIIFFIGFSFLPLGYFTWSASNSVRENITEYGGKDCRIGSICELNVILEEDFIGDVYFYYKLTNYYQNSRRYIVNWNGKQLLGDDLGITTRCSDPYKNKHVNLTKDECKNGSIASPPDICINGLQWVKPSSFEGHKCVCPYAPCGAIANSMFTDVFTFYDSNEQEVPWTFKGLLWEKDIIRFKNPKLLNGEDLCDAFRRRSLPPPNWTKSPCELDPKNPDNNGFQNFDFMVWMNTAAFSTFRKPYRKLKRIGKYENGMPKGLYKLRIQNDYNIAMFNGKKYFIITTISWMGTKNNFLGIMFIIVGSLCLLSGLILLIVHKQSGHTLHEIAQIPRYANDKYD